MLKKLLIGIMIIFSTSFLTGCHKVEAGFVGVKVDLLGSDKGVQQQVVGTGRYWVGLNEELYLFPIYNQLHSYDKPFNFQTSDSMRVSAKIGIEYRVIEDKVSTVFQTYRKGVEEITSENLRQNISDALIKHSGLMDINTLAGEGRTILLDKVTEELNKKLDPIGIKLIKLSWTDDLVYPQQVTDSINAKIEATQKALLRENEIQQSKAEAQKEIEKARGIADSLKIAADAEAQAINIKGEALRRNPEVLQLETISKWNGVLPVYMTSGTQTPLLTIPVGK